MIDRAGEADGEAILNMIESTEAFGPADVACVRQLLNEYLHRPDRGGYEFIVCRQEGHPVGMACYGAAPLTQGTFDLYWICVAPQARGRGIGQELLAEVEKGVRQLGARLLVVETSGGAAYVPARRFYRAQGYQRQATIPDYYAPGEDLVIYTKRFDRPA